MVVVYPNKDLKFMVEHDIICMAIFLTSPTILTPLFGFNLEMECT
jgi:hypothetical protein